MFKVNNKATVVFIVNFEHTSPLALVFLLLTFKHVIAGWEVKYSDQSDRVEYAFVYVHTCQLVENPGPDLYNICYTDNR